MIVLPALAARPAVRANAAEPANHQASPQARAILNYLE